MIPLPEYTVAERETHQGNTWYYRVHHARVRINKRRHLKLYGPLETCLLIACNDWPKFIAIFLRIKLNSSIAGVI